MNKFFSILIILFTRSLFAGELPIIPLPLAITQDVNKVMWIGTHNMVLRYDGQRLNQLTKSRSAVRHIKPTLNGIIYAEKDRVVHISSDLKSTVLFKNENINAIEVNQDIVFILTDNLIYFYSLSQKKVTSKIKVDEASFRSKLVFDSNYLCANLINNVSCFNRSTLKKTTFNFSGVQRIIQHDNKLYITTPTALVMLDYQQSFFSTVIEQEGLGVIASSLNSRYLWIELKNELKKLDLYDKKLVKHDYVRERNSRMFDIFESKDGALWIAANQLEKLTEEPISQTTTSLPDNSGLSHIVMHKGKLYVADYFGLAELDIVDGDSALKTDINKQLNNRIYAMHSTSNHLWLGGNNGFYRVNVDNNNVESLIDILPSKIVMCIKQFNENILMICLASGRVILLNIETLEVNTFTDYKFGEAIDATVGTNNSLWVARSNGLQFKTKSQDTLFLAEHSFMKVYAPSSSSRFIWVGTLDKGLYRIDQYEHTKITNFDMSFIGDQVHDIAEYGNNIWVSSLLGIARINKNTDKVTYFALNKSIGRIYNRSGNFFALASDGNLIFWTNEPEFKEANVEILLSQLLVDGSMQSELQNVSNGNMVEFKTFLSDYNYTSTHQFSFNINNNGWGTYSDNSSVAFKPLYGLNRIKIKAMVNRDNNIESYFDFYVIRPWYLSWASYFVYALILLNVLLIFIIKLKDKSKFRKKMMRNLYEKHHHHTAGDLAIEILPMCKVVEALIVSYHTIEALDTLRNMEDCIVTESHKCSVSSLKTDDLLKAIKYLVTIEGINNKAMIKINIPEFSYDPDLFVHGCRKYIYTVIYEAINNALQHSGADNIEINVITYPDFVQITVNDDGRGMNKNNLKFPGLGLYEIYIIKKLLHANLKITTNSKGTHLKMIVPLKH